MGTVLFVVVALGYVAMTCLLFRELVMDYHFYDNKLLPFWVKALCLATIMLTMFSACAFVCMACVKIMNY